MALTNTWAWTRDVAATINRDGVQCPVLARASQNMAVAAAVLDTLPAPSIDGVDKVYHQLKDIRSITTSQQAKNSLQCRAEVSVSRPGRSKAGW
jgi:hypothetical protein